MKCPNCNHETFSAKSKIVRGSIVTGCERCLPSLVQGTELAASDHRKHDQRTYRADIIQPFETGYAHERGIEAARKAGWSDDAIRRFG